MLYWFIKVLKDDSPQPHTVVASTPSVMKGHPASNKVINQLGDETV